MLTEVVLLTADYLEVYAGKIIPFFVNAWCALLNTGHLCAKAITTLSYLYLWALIQFLIGTLCFYLKRRLIQNPNTLGESLNILPISFQTLVSIA
jgi:hypothetical protein